MDEIESILTGIARDHLHFDTLKTRRCGEDFHEVAVWTVRDALTAAYDAGHARAARDFLETINDRAAPTRQDVVAALELAMQSIQLARNWLLPLRLPVATECGHLLSALDGLRALKRHLRAAQTNSSTNQGGQP